MKDVLEAIVQPLVDFPEDVFITEAENDTTLTLTLKVNKSDMGKVIGRQGRIAKAIRMVMKIASKQCGKKIVVDITED